MGLSRQSVQQTQSTEVHTEFREHVDGKPETSQVQPADELQPNQERPGRLQHEQPEEPKQPAQRSPSLGHISVANRSEQRKTEDPKQFNETGNLSENAGVRREL